MTKQFSSKRILLCFHVTIFLDTFYLSQTFYHRWNNDPLCTGPFPKSFLTYERTLREIRKKRHGKSPQTFEEIATEFGKSEVIDDIGKSLYGAKGALYNGIVIGDDFCNCFFSSEHSISLLKANVPAHERFFVMDGTFRSSPRIGFQQVLIIYTQFGIKVTYEIESNHMPYYYRLLKPIRFLDIPTCMDPDEPAHNRCICVCTSIR